MPLILPSNSISAGGYEVDNSLRFDDGSSDYLNKTFGSSGNRKLWTWSCWLKRTTNSTNDTTFAGYVDANNRLRFNFNPNSIEIYGKISGTEVSVITTQVFRDVSAWYHFVWVMDTAQGTASDRMKIYVNGEQITSFSSTTYPSQNAESVINNNTGHFIGQRGDNSTWLSGYLAECVFIDGQALDPTSFGEFDEDTGIWKPIDVSGLTFGTNGFYLDFQNSGSLGADVSGNGNNFTVNNLTSIDQSTDTCTNNSCVINSLDNHFYNATLSEGNLKQTANSGNYSFGTSTFGISSGKWVVEVKIESGSTVRNVMGITDKVSTGTTNELGSLANGYGYSANGLIYNNGSEITGSYDTFTTNDIIGIYLDLDNNKLYFSKNGTVQNSGTGISITAPSSTTNGVYFFAFGDYGASDDSVNNVNFGSPAFAISSGNTDGEYGNFEYTTTITGDSASKTFKALNTKNLAEYG